MKKILALLLLVMIGYITNSKGNTKNTDCIHAVNPNNNVAFNNNDTDYDSNNFFNLRVAYKINGAAVDPTYPEKDTPKNFSFNLATSSSVTDIYP